MQKINSNKAKEAIEMFKQGYDKSVKPYLNDKAQIAQTELENLIYAIKLSSCENDLTRYYHGTTFLVEIDMILGDLRKNIFPKEGQVQKLETILAKLELSVESGNTYP